MELEDPGVDFRQIWIQENICHSLCVTCWIGRVQGPQKHRSLPEKAGLSFLQQNISLSGHVNWAPGSPVNPFHMSGDVDIFLFRDQERDKAISVSIQPLWEASLALVQLSVT